MMRRRTSGLWTLALLVGLGAPLPAAAQTSRVGPTFNVYTAPTRGSAIAYDVRNDVYLVVSAYGTLYGRFVNADGTPLAPAFVIQASTSFTHFPRVAYSPDADGNAGGFLVTWHESDAPITSIHCRLVSFTGGVVGPDTRLTGTASFWEEGPPVAYSTVSQEFLVAWRAFAPGDIFAARIGNDGALLGSIFPIAATSAHEDNPSIAYNPEVDEFLVTHSSITDRPLFSTLFGQRVKPGTGQLLGTPTPIGQAAGIYMNDVAYDSITGLYLAAWYQDPPKAIYGRLLHADGSPAGDIGALSSRYKAYDALSLAHNRTSGTFFVISHDSISTEDGGVEIDATNTPLSTGIPVTATGSKSGNFYPRIAAHGTAAEWIAVTSGGFVATLGQRLETTRRSGAPPLPIPPKGPPPSTTRLSVNPKALYFGALAGTNALTTGAQRVSVKFTNGTSTWTVTPNAPWLVVSPASGSGAGAFSVSLKPGKWSVGTDSGTITVSAPGTSNRSITVPVTVTTKAAGGNPGGVVDTPVNNLTGVVGSLGVTGWALDDIGIKQVTIWRDPIAGEIPSPANGKMFIGRAVLVEGARPDVAAIIASPFSEKAGWGYMLLTNLLPNQGNGTFVLHAYAEDLEGHVVLLGSRTITCNNTSATRPFGAIDTPDQGETVSGSTYTNFGWALTPMPSRIPIDGSTIWVYIDGIPVGHPTYSQPRDDIKTLFPGRANSEAAVGFFQFDTTLLADGVHTIAWSVTDDTGGSEGIGSRYFSVLNGASTSSLTLDRQSSTQSLSGGGAEVRQSATAGAETGKPALTLASIPASEVPIYTRLGFDRDAPLNLVEADGQGVARVVVGETGRVALTLGSATEGDGYEGYLVANGTLTPLPAGAFLDQRSGDFFWQPGVGFTGSYNLLFVRTENGERHRITVQILIQR